jgi:shikimate kinase
VIVLVGFMGAGKTTVGRLLAARLGLPFVDSDQLIETRTGRAVRRLFAEEGEAYFRDLERRTIAEVAAGPDVVLAVGGGALQDPRTRAALTATSVVHLDVELAEALARVGDDPRRPTLRRPDLAELYAARRLVYEDLASLTVPTGGSSPDGVAAAVGAALDRGGLRGRPAGADQADGPGTDRPQDLR